MRAMHTHTAGFLRRQKQAAIGLRRSQSRWPRLRTARKSRTDRLPGRPNDRHCGAASRRHARAHAPAPVAACPTSAETGAGSEVRDGGEPWCDQSECRPCYHEPVRCPSTAWLMSLLRYIARETKVGARTASASNPAEASLTVIRHNVRGSSGSVRVAECSSEALSQMTTSPTR